MVIRKVMLINTYRFAKMYIHFILLADKYTIKTNLTCGLLILFSSYWYVGQQISGKIPTHCGTLCK